MAIASVATLGTGASGTSTTTLAFSPGSQLDANNIGIIAVVSDNINTSDGDNNEVRSITDSVGNTYRKLHEHTNSNAAAEAGVTQSLWMTKARTAVTTGDTITITFASAIVDKCASCWEFSVAANKTLQMLGRNQNDTDGAEGYGSLSVSGLPSKEYLFFRGLAKEANSTAGITVTTNYTAINNARSRNNPAAVLARGEFRIVTATTETSDPTLAVTGDTASCMVALEEVDDPAILAGTWQGGTKPVAVPHSLVMFSS